MRIEDLNLTDAGGKSRLSAKVSWEDCDRPTTVLFFETAHSFREALACGPEAFLAATLTPAMWAGEKRICVAGDTCPEYLDNIRVAARFFAHWFLPGQAVPSIEAKPRTHAVEYATARNAAVFFSGGLDSLATLRANRLGFPLDHPGSIRDGIIVYGLEVERDEPFRFVVETLTELAEETGVNLIPVSTNIRSLNPDWVFWWTAYMGPALCAVAHALSRRISSVLVASDYEIRLLRPHGSHPLVEPHFSSHELKIRYDGITLSRLEKARLVSTWAPALDRLRVCNKPDLYERGRLNCGRCEKCLRTMLEFLAVGALDRARAFPIHDIDADLVRKGCYFSAAVQPYYDELVQPLKQIGREDLAFTIDDCLRTVRREKGWRGRLRKFDREHLNGSLLFLKRAVAGRA